jgi:hypothetical protein
MLRQHHADVHAALEESMAAVAIIRLLRQNLLADNRNISRLLQHREAHTSQAIGLLTRKMSANHHPAELSCTRRNSVDAIARTAHGMPPTTSHHGDAICYNC